MDGLTPGRRLDARSYEWHRPYQYREVLLNELPFDLDVWDYDLLKIIIQPMLDFLNSENIPYLMSGSGGSKSIHVQVFFHPTYYGVRYSWKAVRMALWNWILDNAEIPKGMRGAGKRSDGVNYAYDSSCNLFSDTAQAGVMRDFGGTAKGKGTKTLIVGELPESRDEIYNGPAKFPDRIELWNPENVIEDELEEGFIQKEIAKFKDKEREINLNWCHIQIAWVKCNGNCYKCPHYFEKGCELCPIDMEWCWAHENMMRGWEAYNWPRLCRACGKVWS
jgi:hypothetical protein